MTILKLLNNDSGKLILYKQKPTISGRAMEGVVPPDEVCVQRVKEKIESYGIKVEFGR